MDRNTIFGFVFIAAILIGWSYLSAPSKEEIKAAQEKQDSLRNVKRTNDSLEIAAKNINIKQDTVKSDTLITSTQKSETTVDTSIFSLATKGEEKFVSMENELIKIKFSNRGAKISSVELKKFKTYYKLPLVLFEGDTNKFDLKFYTGNIPVNTSSYFFQPQYSDNKLGHSDSIAVFKDDSTSISFRLFPSHVKDDSTVFDYNSYIEYKYTLKGDSYLIDFQINFVGMQNIIDRNTPNVDFDFSNVSLPQEKSIDNERNATTIYYKYLLDEVDYLSERKDSKSSLNNKVKWIGLKQQFFTSVIIADDCFLNADIETKSNKNDSAHVKSLFSSIGLPYESKENYNINLSFYFGPNHFNTLKKYHLDLEKQIPLGWGILGWINRFAVIPVFNFLSGFNINYGIIILILTLLIKLLLFPIAYKTYSSSAKMRILKPDIEEINAKFPKKEDALKKQQATMSLYKKAGVNPMAGCLPLLLQMHILIAMFRFFPASIELRQQAFLWADDLSTYDSIFSWTTQIPLLSAYYGNHISLFTILMTITTIIYTKVNNDMMGQTNQMPGMKTMMYIMPLMFLGIFNKYSSALSYYYFLANVITFIQMYVFRFIVNEDSLKRKIESNKIRKVTVKKSGFQQKLEEMAKKRGYNQKKIVFFFRFL